MDYCLPDTAQALIYQRSVVAAMAEAVDRLQAMTPVAPGPSQWGGAAGGCYAIELGGMRETICFLRTMLDSALFHLDQALAPYA